MFSSFIYLINRHYHYILQIAVLSKHHGIPFYVAAPLSSIDMSIPSGDHIVIEERPESEMTYLGKTRIAAPGIS